MSLLWHLVPALLLSLLEQRCQRQFATHWCSSVARKVSVFCVAVCEFFVIIISPLHNKSLSHDQPVNSVLCFLLPLYTCKLPNLICPPNFLSPLRWFAFSVTLMTSCYPMSTSSWYLKIFWTPVCSLTHPALFLSFKGTHNKYLGCPLSWVWQKAYRFEIVIREW